MKGNVTSVTPKTNMGDRLPRPQKAIGLALYSQVYLSLKEKILSGGYTIEVPLPTEDQLASEFAVSRITARRAVLELVAEGLLTRTAGRGTFLTRPPTLRRMVSPLSLEEQLRREAGETRVELLALDYTIAEAAVASLLDLKDTAAEVQHSKRIRRRLDTPVLLLDGHVPAEIGRRFPKNALKTKPLHQCLKEAGHPVTRLVQEFSAVSAPPSLSKWLEVPAGASLVLIERLGFDPNGAAVQYLRMYFPPERLRFRTSSIESGGKIVDSGQFVFV